MRALKCVGCGKFLSVQSVHAAGGSYVCHVKEECLMVLFTKIKKSCNKMNFFSKDSLSQMMSQMFDFSRED